MKRSDMLRLTLVIGLAVITVIPAILSTQQTPRQVFERARVLEESNQLTEAVKLYGQVTAQAKGDRELAAQAQYHIGLAYEKLGSTEARKAYERVVRDYPKETVAAEAGRRLADLRGLATSAERTDRSICSDCGGNSAPSSVSADGRFLAYNGPSGLSIRDIASGQVTRILNEPSFSPVVSPDGKQIAYLGATRPGVKFVGGDPLGSYDLRIVANKVGAKPRILNTDLRYRAIVPAAWAPDGKSILVSINNPDGSFAIAWVSAVDGSVRELKSLPSKRFGCCHNLGLPSLSPDGRYIAYAAWVNDRSDPNEPVHIYVLSSDGSELMEPVKGASVNEDPAWMPDGKSLLFVSDRGGSFGLWSVTLKDGVVTPVQPGTGEIRTIGVSISGSYFYTRPVQNNSPLFEISELHSAETGNAQTTETISGTFSGWSPDGTRLAFTRQTNNNRGRGGGEELVQVCADPSNPETLARELRTLTEAAQEHPRAVQRLLILDRVSLG